MAESKNERVHHNTVRTNKQENVMQKDDEGIGRMIEKIVEKTKA